MQTYSKLWIHAIWSTKHRQPLLRPEFRETLYRHIIERAGQEEVSVRSINGTEDHLHCLMRIYPKHSVSGVVNVLKGESSSWINKQEFLRIHFAWQKGYSAFSVSESKIPEVQRYIANQEEHHRVMSYREEVERLLDLHEVERA